MKNLGFGMMRLPVLSGPTDFDYEQLNRMVDAFLEAEHIDFHKGLEKQTVITADGTDITDLVEKAVVWLTEHSF
jgi:hypothetical protein